METRIMVHYLDYTVATSKNPSVEHHMNHFILLHS